MSVPEWIITAEDRDCFISPELSGLPALHAIAHSLAQLNRFTGHAKRPYSVAEHSVVCLRIARQAWPTAPVGLLAACLFHDAGECITGDVSSPVKRTLGADWHKWEASVEDAVWRRIHPDLPFHMHTHADRVRAVDLTALWLERRHLFNFDPELQRPWPLIDGPDFRPLIRRLTFGKIPSWQQARDRFLAAAGQILGN